MPRKFKIGDIVHYTPEAPLCRAFLGRHPRGPYLVVGYVGVPRVSIEYLDGGTKMRSEWKAHNPKWLRKDEFLTAVKRANNQTKKEKYHDCKDQKRRAFGNH